MRIELLTAPGCPNAAAAKQVIIDCLADLGIEALVRARIGPYPSPTVLIDGIDVMRGDAPPAEEACRLDPPTLQRVRDALRAHASSNTGTG